MGGGIPGSWLFQYKALRTEEFNSETPKGLKVTMSLPCLNKVILSYPILRHGLGILA